MDGLGGCLHTKGAMRIRMTPFVPGNDMANLGCADQAAQSS